MTFLALAQLVALASLPVDHRIQFDNYDLQPPLQEMERSCQPFIDRARLPVDERVTVLVPERVDSCFRGATQFTSVVVLYVEQISPNPHQSRHIAELIRQWRSGFDEAGFRQLSLNYSCAEFVLAQYANDQHPDLIILSEDQNRVTTITQFESECRKFISFMHPVDVGWQP